MKSAFALAGLFAAALLASAPALAADPPPTRDGAHDFDFNLGTWRTEILRHPHPFSAPDETTPVTGTVKVRPVWGGRGWLEEIEGDSAKGHWQGLTLFLYDPKGRQWSQTFVGTSDGTFSTGTVGAFKEGRGELYAMDTFESHSVIVRGTWSEIAPDSHRYEEAFSADGGRTWAEVFDAHLTRIKP